MGLPISTILQAISPIAGGAQGAFNNFSINQTNKENRGFAEQMYNWQRRDALADFHMQNEYNSPSNQMSRLKEAGLNPNLVYGGGSATQTSANVRPSSAPGYKAEPMSMNLIAPMMMMMNTIANTANKQADTANKEAALPGIKADSWVKDEGAGFRLGILNRQLDKLIPETELVRANIEKKDADIAFTLAQNIRADMATGQSIAESVQRVKKMISDMGVNDERKQVMKQMVRSIEEDIKDKQFTNQLHGGFMTSGDPMKIFQLIVSSLLRGFSRK